MSFASQLANLQKTAEQAATTTSSSSSNPSSSSPYNRPNNNYHHDNKRRRFDNHNNNHHYNRNRRDRVPSVDYNDPNFVSKLQSLSKCRITPTAPSSETSATTTKSITTTSSSTSTSTPPLARKDHHHLTLLFVTIDELPHEEIWKAWIDNHPATKSKNKTPPMLISFIVHAKHPERIRSPWLRRHLLTCKKKSGYEPHTYRPEWGSIEITRAMIDLLREGLRIGVDEDRMGEPSARRFMAKPEESRGDIPPSTRFVFCSESCLPIRTLRETEMLLYPENDGDLNYSKSWIKAVNEPNNGYARQLQWDSIPSVIPRENIWKTDQWIMLNRTHAKNAIFDIYKGFKGCKIQLWQVFRGCKASDEMYFSTALSLLGVLRKDEDNHEGEVLSKRVTYSDWSTGAKNPSAYCGFNDYKQVMKLAREEGCLFARKFVLGSEGEGKMRVQDWQDLLTRMS